MLAWRRGKQFGPPFYSQDRQEKRAALAARFGFTNNSAQGSPRRECDGPQVPPILPRARGQGDRI